MCRLPTSFLLNIQSRVKQEVDMPQIQKCVTPYSSPYWCSVPNIRKLACVVLEKNVTEIFCDADARGQKWSLYVASAKAGRRHNKNECPGLVFPHHAWESHHTTPHFIHKALPLMNIILQNLRQFCLLKKGLGALQKICQHIIHRQDLLTIFWEKSKQQICLSHINHKVKRKYISNVIY